MDSLNEFFVGGVDYSDAAGYLGAFREGVLRGFDLLNVLPKPPPTVEDTNISLRRTMMQALVAGVRMMAEMTEDQDLAPTDIVEAANRFLSEINLLCEDYHGISSDTSPEREYIPGREQSMLPWDTERFKSGVFRKESDQLMSPTVQRVLVQNREVAPASLTESGPRPKVLDGRLLAMEMDEAIKAGQGLTLLGD